MSSPEEIVASVLARLGNGSSPESPKTKTRKKGSHRQKKGDPIFPVQPRLIQEVKRPKTYMNHSYRDFSQVPPTVDHVEPTEIADMTFAQKVHHILSQEEYRQWISWMPHGRSFRVLIPKRLEQAKVLMKYFGHNRYSSFLRQLNNFGFKHLTRGEDRNTYYHEFMLRGLPHLAVYMPESKDARRLIPDPENEPNLLAISKEYPLPGAQGDLPEVEVEETTKQPAAALPSTASIPVAEPLAKVPRMMLSSADLAAASMRQPVLDVSHARAALSQQAAALSALQNQLQLEQELAAIRLLRQQQQEESAAASLAAYTELLRNSTLSNLMNQQP